MVTYSKKQMREVHAFRKSGDKDVTVWILDERGLLVAIIENDGDPVNIAKFKVEWIARP